MNLSSVNIKENDILKIDEELLEILLVDKTKESGIRRKLRTRQGHCKSW